MYACIYGCMCVDTYMHIYTYLDKSNKLLTNFFLNKRIQFHHVKLLIDYNCTGIVLNGICGSQMENI